MRSLRLLSYLLILLRCSAYGNEPIITKYGIEHGLSSDYVESLYQDSLGYLWIGTINGLNKFDGNNFTPVLSNSPKLRKLKNNHIRCIEKADNEKLWLGTQYGLYLFDRRNNTFQSYFKRDDAQGLSFNEISDILFDEGDLWIATDGAGINKYQKETNSFLHYKELGPFFNGTGNMLSIDRGWNNTILFSAWRGLKIYDKKTQQFQSYLTDKYTDYNLKNDHVFSSLQLDSNTLWLASNEGVEMKINHGEVNFTNRTLQPGDEVATLFKDKNGLIWSGGSKSLNVYQKEGKDYRLVHQLLANHSIRCILQDQEENIWVGTEDGLFKISFVKREYDFYSIGTSAIQSITKGIDSKLSILTNTGVYKFENKAFTKALTLDTRMPYSRVVETETEYFLGTPNQGVFKYDKSSQSFTKLNNYSPRYPGSGQVTTLLLDSDKTLWVGNVIGINTFNINDIKNTYKLYNYDPGDFSYYHTVKDFTEDKEGHIWVATNGNGLEEFDPKTGKFSYHAVEIDNPSTISDNYVSCVALDQQGNIWAAHRSGISYYDKKNKSFKNYYLTDAGSGEWISNLIIDQKGGIWLSLSKDFYYFDPKKEYFENFENLKITQAETILGNSSELLSDGSLTFCTSKGIIVIQPDSVLTKKQNKISPLHFSVLNASSESNLTITKDITFLDSIQFDAKIKNITISFHSIYFNSNANESYEVQLKGYDDAPYYTNDTKLAYSGLAYGKYELVVKNRYKKESEPISLVIVIPTPWWRTYTAIIVFSMAALAGIIYLFFYFEGKNRQRLEKERTKQEALFKQEKINFFTSVSHDLKTPLTLISAPIKDAVNEGRPLSATDALLVNKNVNHLQELIYELLEFESLETKDLQLSVEQTDLFNFTQQLSGRFEYLSKENDIDFSLTLPEANSDVWIDQSKVGKVMMNILTNAFKYARSKVDFEVRHLGESIRFIVTDNGEGISTELQQQIFTPFVSKKTSNIQQGTGLGLSISKQLVELHQGSIQVESQLNEWTKFIIEIPTIENNYTKEEKIVLPKETNENYDSDITVLIVEDNNDIRNYLKSKLGLSYKILDAENGKKGLAIANEAIPDIIISDVMMPEMTGVELTSALKETITTSHIPVILLTAQFNQDEKIKALSSGADYFLSKPFELEELKLRIQNVLSLKKSIKHTFLNEYKAGILPNLPTDLDTDFLTKNIQFIEEEIDNPSLSASLLAEHNHMSASQLLKKVKSLTGQTVSELIETIRLKRAALLLTSSDVQIKEVAFSVGFTDQRYFARRFKAFYGKTPSEYVKS